MSSDQRPAEDGGTEHQKDAPGERRKIQLPSAKILGSPLPGVDLKISNMLGAANFGKNAALGAQLSSISLPESTLNRLRGLAGAAGQYSKIADSIGSALRYQDRLNTQFNQINSDLFKTQTASQAQFARLSADLTKTFDFGINNSVAKLMQQFAAQQESWLTEFEPTFELFKKGLYPPNLREIDNLEFEEVEKVVMADAIALYGVPRPSVAEALIGAESAAKRREILGRRWSTISADCREAVGKLKSEAATPYSSFALAVVDALDNNHTEAAQALAGSLIDSMLTNYFGKDRFAYTPDRKGERTTEAYEKFTVREFIAFAPMWQVYQQFWVNDGDQVPNTFSRNATAHTVSPRQYNRRNAIQAVLFATGLLFFFDQQGLRLEARRRKSANQQSEQ